MAKILLGPVCRCAAHVVLKLGFNVLVWLVSLLQNFTVVVIVALYFVLLLQARRRYSVWNLLTEVIGELEARTSPLKTETRSHLMQYTSLMLSSVKLLGVGWMRRNAVVCNFMMSQTGKTSRLYGLRVRIYGGRIVAKHSHACICLRCIIFCIFHSSSLIRHAASSLSAASCIRDRHCGLDRNYI